MNAQENIKNDEINFQADALNDLPVTDEQAGETKGGGRIVRNPDAPVEYIVVGSGAGGGPLA